LYVMTAQRSQHVYIHPTYAAVTFRKVWHKLEYSIHMVKYICI